MKKIIHVLLMSMISMTVYSQKDERHERDVTLIVDDSTEQINRIKNQIAFINNNLDSFKKIERMKDKDGYRYVYFKGKELQLVHINTRHEGMDKDVKWYFQNGHMIYVEKLWTYPEHSNMVGSHEKAYLYNGNVVGWTMFDKPVDGNSSEFKEFAKKLKEYGQEELEKEKL